MNEILYSTIPFVKWAGGKRQLLPFINTILPKKYNRYFEPFVGGGALLFDLQPHNAFINDINKSLINTYIQIKDYPIELIQYLDKLDTGLISTINKNKYYYRLRDLYNYKLLREKYDIETAALLIFLNKHCFNGLYRVNKKGLFNVPYNGKINISFEYDNIKNIALFLNKSVHISNGDFEDACKNVREGDFVFIDSPYAPLNSNTFTNYTEEGFGLQEHIRLSELFKRLDSKGAFCMLTNHNTKLIHDLYSEYIMSIVPVKRNINSNPNNRNSYNNEEVIIRNYRNKYEEAIYFRSR